jgi:suppressor for copper-sensitivity B
MPPRFQRIHLTETTGIRPIRWLLIILLALVTWPSQALAQMDPGPDGPQAKAALSAVWWQDKTPPSGQNVLAIVIDIIPNWHIASDAAQGIEGGFKPFHTTVDAATDHPGLTFGPAQFPKTHTLPVGGLPDPIAVFDGKAVIYIPVTVAADAEPGTADVRVTVKYQACDDMTCDFPKTVNLQAALLIAAPGGTAAGAPPDHADLFAGFDLASFEPIAEVAGGTEATESVDFFFLKVDPSGLPGFAALLLLAAIGGALLNFTPCVLPVIPIKILGLARTAGNRRRTFMLGAAMAVGVVAFWLGLGIAIAGVSGFTASNQLFQYPLFSIGVGVIIAVMAVGMCGLFAVKLPNFVYSISPKHDSYPGSFGFGVMTAVLSTPCTAPLMGAAAAWAATQDPGITLATFAAIGVGMALPYLVLSANPRLVDALPRTGPGSELLKQIMGLLMLAAAAFFVGAGVSGFLSDGTQAAPKTHWWVVAALIAAAGLWLIVRVFKATPSTSKRGLFVVLGLVAIVAAGLGGNTLTRPDKWVYYTPERFEKALAEGNTVLLDFTADWCANCHLLEETVLNRDEVQDILQSDGYVAMKVDLTSVYPDGKLKLKESGSVTIPWLVIYDPDGREVFKANWYTTSQIIDALTNR